MINLSFPIWNDNIAEACNREDLIKKERILELKKWSYQMDTVEIEIKIKLAKNKKQVTWFCWQKFRLSCDDLWCKSDVLDMLASRDFGIKLCNRKWRLSHLLLTWTRCHGRPKIELKFLVASDCLLLTCLSFYEVI